MLRSEPASDLERYTDQIMKDHASNSQAERVETMLKAGCEVTGSAIGGAMGFFLGGPVGGAAAGAIGTATGGLLADIATRMLSQREKARVGATAQYAFEQIQRNLDAGQTIRRDTFMSGSPDRRAPFEEILEGVLIKAQREHEEKKIRYLGQFLGNIAFDANCSGGQANYLLSLLERLTYQQLVMIRTFRPLVIRGNIAPDLGEDLSPRELDYISRRMEEQESLRMGLLESMESGAFNSDGNAANAALMELFSLNVVHYQQRSPLDAEHPQSMNYINYNTTFSTGIGEAVHDLCGLENIPIEDIDSLKRAFNYADMSWLRRIILSSGSP
jgi:hypothetical protein